MAKIHIEREGSRKLLDALEVLNISEVPAEGNEVGASRHGSIT